MKFAGQNFFLVVLKKMGILFGMDCYLEKEFGGDK